MLQNLFFKNFGKIIISIVLAIMLWFIANINENIEKPLDVEVNYSDLSPELVIMGKPPETIRLKAQGPRSRILTLSPGDFVFSLDLSAVGPGVSRFEVHANQIKYPRGIQVVSITPAEIKLDVDRLVEKEVELKPLIGLPASGYEIVGDPVVKPNRVKVKGPNKILYSLKNVTTDLVSTVGAKSKFTIEVPLKSPPYVEIVDVETAHVTVDIQERISVKEFKNMDIEFINFDELEIELKTGVKSNLVFEGPYSAIKELNSDNIRVYVDGKDVVNKNKGKIHTFELIVSYPFEDSITLKKKAPANIRIRFN
ncbi:MAG: YbbR-like domain-containing protein [Candidatus Dadabacteria bacterium]|nr:YbbR-like domain-containing protein [Candidatus Dadabacteria bacterium]